MKSCLVSVISVTIIQLTNLLLPAASFSSTGYAASQDLRCSFARDWCKWRNRYGSADDFNWKRGLRTDALQRGSGARYDHSGDGWYLYIKSTKKGNRTAQIYSPNFRLNEDACFQFYYYMRGNTLGHLEVLLVELSPNNVKTAETPVWNLRGHQAAGWKEANIPLRNGTHGYIIIEAFDWEKGRSGNILIDDTSLVTRSSSCRTILPLNAKPVVKEATTTLSTSTTIPQVFSTLPQTVTDAPTFMTNQTLLSMFGSPQMWNASSHMTFQYSMSTVPLKSVSGTMGSKIAPQNLSQTTEKWIKSSIITSMIIKQNFTLGTTKKSNTGVVVGVTVALFVVSLLLVALLIYFRKRRQKLSCDEKCSVKMTRMYPDITVNTNISFQKLS